MNIEDRPYRCYGVRRLNPFLGVIQIVASSDSRAISYDGENWEIQVKTERPGDTWGGKPQVSSRQFLRFGTWSRRAGLTKVPANPLLDLTRMLAETAWMIGRLEHEQSSLPFPLADRFEYWLLDGRSRIPLALIASATDRGRLAPPATRRWRCAQRMEQDFPAPDMDRHHPPHPRDSDPHPHMSALERLVRLRSGGVGCWYQRDAAGSGQGVAAGEGGVPGDSELPASAFPELLLCSAWEDGHHRRLVSDYLTWLSPALLTLHGLSDRKREKLERKAVKRALSLDQQWRLYPRIIDRSLIKKARVEATLRRTTDK